MTYFNQPNKADACAAHSQYMKQQIDAYLESAQCPQEVRDAIANPDKVARVMPAIKIDIKKPTRGQHIVWQEQARENWLCPRRQRKIYQHFAYNGIIPHKYTMRSAAAHGIQQERDGVRVPEFIQFSTREQHTAAVFKSDSDSDDGGEGEPPSKRTKAATAAKKEDHTAAVAAHLAARFTGLEVAGGENVGPDERDCAAYTRECTGIDPTEEERELTCIGDILPSVDRRVEWEQ